jgi:flagellar hook-length control protein FliK
MKTTNVELNENSVVGKNSFIKISNNASVNKEIVKHVDYKHLLNEISKGILSSEGKRIIFNLEPEHLGKIKITMSLVKELMSVKIEAESAEVKHYIESNIKQIEQQLIQQGGGNATISVSLMTQEQKSNSYFTKPKKKQSNIDDNKIDSKIEAKEENKSQKRLGYNTYEYLA